MDVLMIVIYLFVIFCCMYSIYLLGQMRDCVDKIDIELGRMSKTLNKYKDD